MSAQQYRGLFFTSPPKAGKNLIYSFLEALRYRRLALDREARVRLTEQPWLRKAGKKCTYALDAAKDDGSGLADASGGVIAPMFDEIPPREVIHHHFPYHSEMARSLAVAKAGVVLLIRDPRDILVSMADYIIQQRKPQHLANRWSGWGRAEIIKRLWSGDDTLLDFDAYLRSFLGWRSHPGVLELRFEDMIGEKGGGTLAAQVAAVHSLSALIGVAEAEAVERGRLATFNPRAGTYFKGIGGRWRLESEPEVQSILNLPLMQSLAKEYGYPAAFPADTRPV